jgi:hypothetical protein
MPIIDEWRGKYLRPGSNLHYRYQDVELTQRERAIFEEIDGQHKVDEVLNALDIELERAYQIIYTLIVTEMVELIDAPLDKPELLVVETDEQPAPVAPPKAAPAAPPKAAPATRPKPRPHLSRPSRPPRPNRSSLRRSRRRNRRWRSSTRKNRRRNRKRPPTRKSAKRCATFTPGNRRQLFSCVGVGENPTEHEVRLAYHRMAKEFHPDRSSAWPVPKSKPRSRKFPSGRQGLRGTQHAGKDRAVQRQACGRGGRTQDRRAHRGREKDHHRRTELPERQAIHEGKALRARRVRIPQAMEITSNEAEYIAHYGWAMYNIPYEEGISEEDAKLFQGESPSDLQFKAAKRSTVRSRSIRGRRRLSVPRFDLQNAGPQGIRGKAVRKGVDLQSELH